MKRFSENDADESDRLIIRLAGVDDIPQMVGLLAELFSIEEDFEVDPAKQQEGLCLMLTSPHHRAVFVAELDQVIIGMVSAQLLISTAEGALSSLMEDMIITAEHRGKQVGSQLLAAIEQWSVQQGATRIQLLTEHSNQRAINFYRNNQWQSTGLICMRKHQ